MTQQRRAKAVWLASALSIQIVGCAVADDGVDSPPGSGSGGDTGSSGSAVGNAGAPGSSGSSVNGASGASVGTGGAGGSDDIGGAGMGGAVGSAGNSGGGGGNRTPDAGVARPDAGSFPAADGGPPSNPAVDALCTPQVTYMNQFPTSTGGMRFDKAVPDVTATLQAHSRTICRYIFRKPEDVNKNAQVSLVIDNHNGVAQTGGARIQFSANYIGGIGGNDAAISFEINGVLVHEATHIWQYDNGGGALVEAMADYVRYRSGFDKLSRRRTGGNWSDPYTTGGFFIAWVEDKYDKDWGYKVNMGMKTAGFSYPKFIQDTFGKSADALWAEYQADIR